MKALKRANEYFQIPLDSFNRTGAFNPVIGIDSLFFVDPVLLGKSSAPELRNALGKVRKYFSGVVTLLRTKNDRAWKLAKKRLIFPEIRGTGIGYGRSSDDGAAIGPTLSRELAETASELLDMGIEDPALFEVMGLFQDGFGPDRLSDALINILLEEILGYTERVTSELGMRSTAPIATATRRFMVPRHPLGGKPLILIPTDILRDIPVVMSYADLAHASAFNEELRNRFNELIAPVFFDKKNHTKRDVKQYLFEDRSKIQALIETYRRSSPASYDFEGDPRGRYLWLEKARKITEQNPLGIPQHVREEGLDTVVKKIIESFQKFIQFQGGWRVLYAEGKPLNERHARTLFYATALIYCELSNVDISPESNAGLGPVDFKLSRGARKIVVEIKLSKGQVKHGYLVQTGLYQSSENAEKSYYLVLRVTEKSSALKEIRRIEEKERKAGRDCPVIIVIDARRRLSASRAK